jgi:tetratricopeptide (TPR) repeat protein
VADGAPQNTVASAWRRQNCNAVSGDGSGAIGAYEEAIITRGRPATWDSIVLSIVKLQAETGNVAEVNRWAESVRKGKPENLLSVYLVSGNAYHQMKIMDAASEAYRNAFDLLRKASAEEQVKLLSSLIRIYADLGLQDRIFETLANLRTNWDFVKNDELSILSNACGAGIQVANDGRHRIIQGGGKVLKALHHGFNTVREDAAVPCRACAPRDGRFTRGSGKLLDQIFTKAAAKLPAGRIRSDDVVTPTGSVRD